MILHLHKCLYVPGNEDLNCELSEDEGWAGELTQDRHLKAYKRVSGWKFYHPYNQHDTFEIAKEDCCGHWTSVPYNSPMNTFANDWVYLLNVDHPFEPFK